MATVCHLKPFVPLDRHPELAAAVEDGQERDRFAGDGSRLEYAFLERADEWPTNVSAESVLGDDVSAHMEFTSGVPPAVVIVGLPDKAIREAGERVRAALLSSGLSLPPRRIIVNLAPADLPKEGSHYDLPIALALMGLIGAFPEVHPIKVNAVAC